MSTVTMQEPINLDNEDGKMWHVVDDRTMFTLCGKDFKGKETFELSASHIECVVCAELLKM